MSSGGGGVPFAEEEGRLSPPSARPLQRDSCGPSAPVTSGHVWEDGGGDDNDVDISSANDKREKIGAKER